MTKSISALTAVKSPVSFTIEKPDGKSKELAKYGEVVNFLNGYFEKDSPYPGKVLKMDCSGLQELYTSDGFLKELGQPETALKEPIDILNVIVLIACNELANNPKFNSKNQSQLNLSLIKKCLKQSNLSSGDNFSRTNSRVNFLLNFIILIDAINEHENISLLMWESKKHEKKSIFTEFLKEHSVSGSKETLNKNLQQFLVNCAVFAETIDEMGGKRALFCKPVKRFLSSLKQSLIDTGRTDIDFESVLHNHSGDLLKKIASTSELGPLSLAPPPSFQMIASQQIKKRLGYQAIDQHVWDRIEVDSAPELFAPQKQFVIPPLEKRKSSSAKELREELRSEFSMRPSETQSAMTITAQGQQSTSAMFSESSVEEISMRRESGSASDYGLPNNFSIVIPKAKRPVEIPEFSLSSKPPEFISLFSSNESAFESSSKKAKINTLESSTLISEGQPSRDVQEPFAERFIASSKTPE